MPNRKKGTVKDTQSVISDSHIMKELIVKSLFNISVFAHMARRFTMTDHQIDRFVVDTLAMTLRKDPLLETETLWTLQEGSKLLTRATKLYQWSCEAFSNSYEKIDSCPILENEINPTNLRKALRKTREQLPPLGYHDLYYWHQVVLTKLSTFATIVSVAQFDIESDDIYGVFHKSLYKMWEGLSVFELVALAQLIEKEQFNFVNAQTTGNTLVELPTVNAVRRSEILVIRETSPNQTGHIELG